MEGGVEGGWREGRVEECYLSYMSVENTAPKSLMCLGSVAAGKSHSGFLGSGYNTYIQPGNSTTVHIHWL